MAQIQDRSKPLHTSTIRAVSPTKEQWSDDQAAWPLPQQLPTSVAPPSSSPTDTPANRESERRPSLGSIQNTPPRQTRSIQRKLIHSPTIQPASGTTEAGTSHESSPQRRTDPSPTLHIAPEFRLQETLASPVNIRPPQFGIAEPETARISQAFTDTDTDSRRSSRNAQTPEPRPLRKASSNGSLPFRGKEPPTPQEQRPSIRSHSRNSSSLQMAPPIEENGQYVVPEMPQSPGLQYHHFEDESKKARSGDRVSQMTTRSAGSSSSGGDHTRTGSATLSVPRGTSGPASTNALGAELRGRTLSPLSAAGSDPGSPASYARDLSTSRRSPLSRPSSYVDLLNNVPYHQQIAPAPPLNNAGLQSVVGSAASLLDTKKTLTMYRANVKKTTDPAVQYEFAIFMINAAVDVLPEDGLDPAELTNEGKHILQRLSDRAYPFAQYYLADGYFSGLFNKGKPDYDKAFPLFVAASKHGHAEAGYRAALCYEFGWGCAKAYPKAVQFYRASASKGHPGAATRLGLACIRGDMGLRDKYREGIKWLKRATESADFQYNTAPYELGLMHLEGFGGDIFKDEAYAAQLLTQSAELGHPQANFLMGQAYENGLYGCPRDAALSVHFYNGAATRGHVDGMMALCAWYMVGAEPVLEKDEAEAYAWAQQAAQTGFAKAEYAVGYFTEMGIGCQRDPLEANVWYVKAADQGFEAAKQRLSIIHAAASGESGVPMSKALPKSKELGAGKKKFMGIF